MPLPSLERPDWKGLLAVGLANTAVCGVLGLLFGYVALERTWAGGWFAVGTVTLVAAAAVGAWRLLSPVRSLTELDRSEASDVGNGFEELSFGELRLVTAEDEAECEPATAEPRSSWALHDDVDGLRVVGRGRVEFEAGERIVAMHVPFVPPFESVPSFEFEVETDGDASLSGKVTQLRSYGVRLEVRRSGSLDGTDVCHVEWVASPPAEDVRAA